MLTQEELKEVEEVIAEFKQSLIYPLMPLFKTGLIHRTNAEGWQGIQESGYIKPNVQNRFPVTTVKSASSFGQAKKSICLFDFEFVAEEDYGYVFENWERFFYEFKPTIVLKINRQKLSKQQLIQNKAAHCSLASADYKCYIPDVECWYPEPIPLSFIESCILIWEMPGKLEYKIFSADDVGSVNQEIQAGDLLSRELAELLGISVEQLPDTDSDLSKSEIAMFERLKKLL